MWTRRTLGAFAAAVTLAIAGCGSDTGSDSSGVGTGDGDPAGGSDRSGGGQSELTFTATTVEGEEFDAAALSGEPAIFWFWAPWCTTCMAEAPHVLDLAKQYGERLNVVGVASLGQPDEMAEFIERTGTSSLTHLNDEVGTVWQHFGITAQSTFALVDSAGAVTYTGYLEMGELSDRVDQLAG
jgi:thiol-disulfide isomerase/thioredoxin